MVDPTIKVPEVWRDKTVPPTVAAGPPALIVVPAIVNVEGLGVTVWPAIIISGPARGFVSGVSKEISVLPMVNWPDWPRLIIVPSMVSADPPGEMDPPLMTKPAALAVMG